MKDFPLSLLQSIVTGQLLSAGTVFTHIPLVTLRYCMKQAHWWAPIYRLGDQDSEMLGPSTQSEVTQWLADGAETGAQVT